ncbi:acyl-CoA dehydrogenase family protein [Saccharomonospora sp. NPDC046836]|uniref:acyl-CoA dehydrogenase family protein n=1 Tax=Saccharomonospora sp. NPDC046836 TaxID=3156921 RepID=UPI00340E469A
MPAEDDARALAEGLGDYLRRDYPEPGPKTAAADAGLWEHLAAIGALGLTVATEYGGEGATPVETYYLAETLGRHLVTAPYLTALVCGRILAAAGDPGAAARAELFAGRQLVGLAHGEGSADHPDAPVGTTATRTTGVGWRLSGSKCVVMDGGAADLFVVSARPAAAGPLLFLVPRSAEGLSLQPYPTIDGRGAVDLHLDEVRVPEQALLGGVPELLGPAYDEVTAASCAEAVGVIGTVLDATVEHVRTRRQFGAPLGSLQVVRHRLVELLLLQEQSRSLALRAARELAAGAPTAARTVAAAKVKCNEAAAFAGRESVQLHGGLGMTDELPLSNFVKRLLVIQRSFGETRHHLARLSNSEEAQ